MRKFGIELEMGLKSGKTLRDASAALAAAGLGGNAHNYIGHSETQWVVKTDASVPGGIEVVSPPLDFDNEDQRNQLNTAVAALKDIAQPDRNAGIHVHVESRDLTARQISGVARCFAHFEDVIYRIASSGWATLRAGATTFARPLTDDQKTRLARATTDSAVMSAYYGSAAAASVSTSHSANARYCGLNLHSHFYRGTIEFRVFNSSLNARRVQTYVAVCMAIVQDARNGHLRSVNKSFKLGDMAAGTADADKAFFQFLTVVRYHADMSLSDYQNLKKIWKDTAPQLALSRSRWA